MPPRQTTRRNRTHEPRTKRSARALLLTALSTALLAAPSGAIATPAESAPPGGVAEEAAAAVVHETPDGADFLTVHGHLLIRPEYVDNVKDFDDARGDEDLFYRQRIRLGLTVRPLEWLRLRADLQNATLWGLETTGESDPQNRLGFYQAYLSLDVPFAPGLTLEGGRMALEYGAGRLIGADEFLHVPRFFDGAVARYTYAPYIRVDLFGSVLRERSTPIGQDRNLFGLYATTHALAGFTFDLYALYLQDGSPEQARDIVTIGARAAGEPLPGLTFDAEAAIQVGRADTTAREDVEHFATAYFVAVDYAIPVWGRPTLGAFFSSASGDGDPGDDRDVDFDPLFGSRHDYWGRLDLFSWTNLLDFGGRFRLTPVAGLGLLVEAHRFLAVEPRGSVPGLWGGRTIPFEVDDALGTELDIVLGWRYDEHLAFEVGYVVFLPDEAVRDVLDGDDRVDWAYAQVRMDL